MTYDIYKDLLGVWCRSERVVRSLQEFLMGFTALQVGMLGRCGTGTAHQTSRSTLWTMIIRWGSGGYTWHSLVHWLTWCEYHPGSVHLEIACNWQLWLGANFLVLRFIQGYSCIVYNSVRLITYGYAGGMGQLWEGGDCAAGVVSTATWHCVGSSVRWQVHSVHGGTTDINGGVVLFDEYYWQTIWVYDPTKGVGLEQLPCFGNWVLCKITWYWRLALTRYMENDCTTSYRLCFVYKLIR